MLSALIERAKNAAAHYMGSRKALPVPSSSETIMAEDEAMKHYHDLHFISFQKHSESIDEVRARIPQLADIVAESVKDKINPKLDFSLESPSYSGAVFFSERLEGEYRLHILYVFKKRNV